MTIATRAKARVKFRSVDAGRRKGTLVQYAGRLHRLHPGKREVRIYDYADNEVPMLRRMFEKRLRGYGAIGYVSGPGQIGYL